MKNHKIRDDYYENSKDSRWLLWKIKRFAIIIIIMKINKIYDVSTTILHPKIENTYQGISFGVFIFCLFSRDFYNIPVYIYIIFV